MPGAKRGAGDGDPLAQQQAQVQLRAAPALQADHHEAAVVLQGRDVLFEVRRPDDVENDIDPYAAEVVGPIVDGLVGAEFAQTIVLVANVPIPLPPP